MYRIALLLILIALLFPTKESFSVHIESDFNGQWIKDGITSVKEGLQNTVRPVYTTFTSFIPYKHHFRKLRRQFR